MEIKIGLEIHVYLNMEKSQAKLFCNCFVNHQSAAPNTNICPVCTGLPGSKPMLPNKEALEKALAIAAMLKCKINKQLVFQRKHYSWPDLPNGFQKTMSGPNVAPVGAYGELNNIQIWGLHIEEDPAKWDPKTGTVDYNRSGVPLVEIVTAPDLTSPEEAKAWLRSLVILLSYVKAVPRNTAIKADVNVNVAGHPRVEVKNVNSFKNICAAIEHEVKRQSEVIKTKKVTEIETRGFNELDSSTFHMRFKESADDYRFIPEPDLLPITVPEDMLQSILETIPKTPEEKMSHYKEKHKLTEKQVKIVTSDLVLATLFEEIVKSVDPHLTANWLTIDFLKLFKEEDPETFSVDVKELTKILKLLEQKKITEKVTKDMIRKLLWEKLDVASYHKKFGAEKISDISTLEPLCLEVLKQHQDAVANFKKGKEQAFHFLVGQVMAKTKGKADHAEVTKLLKKLIN